MKMELRRYTSNPDSTGGLLFINDHFFGFTCEDQFQAEKVMKETRIPSGVYEIKFRDAGGMNDKYKKRYEGHIGMLHLQNVPDFEWVYIHTGNNDDHTEGCILVGYAASFSGESMIQISREAYKDLYQLCKLADSNGEQIHIEVTDL